MGATNGAIWRKGREDMHLTSDQAASLLGITGGGLRGIELERRPASDGLARAASRLYRIPTNELFRAAEDPKGKPVKPEPKVEPVGPGPRPARKTGPKRARSAA
jgi:DNA-binding XRE family transcriptional regulator